MPERPGHEPHVGLPGPISARQSQCIEVKAAVLIIIVAVALLVAPKAAEAQQRGGKLWRIGVLMSLYPPDADVPQALREGLRTLGYIEGQNLVIEWRYTQGRDDRLPTLAAE